MFVHRVWIIWVVICFTCACETTILIEPEEISFTENGTVVDGNRFFFIGGDTLYELISKSDGTHQGKVVTKRNDCVFTGLTSHESKLYAACTASDDPITAIGAMEVAIPQWSDIVRVDLLRNESDSGRIATTRLEGEYFFPNGMAADERGDIYISNSYSMIAALLFLKTTPAVIRVRVVDEQLFEINKKAVVSAAKGGLSPNGIQIQNGRLWYVSGSTLYEAKIIKDGLSDMKTVYRVSSSRIFDDFAVLPENILAVVEIPSPLSATSILFPEQWPPKSDPSQLTFVSVGPGALSEGAGEVLYEYEFEYPITPSSATPILDDKGSALYVTDYFFGGVYRVGPL